jgi:hypothetical protein
MICEKNAERRKQFTVKQYTLIIFKSLQIKLKQHAFQETISHRIVYIQNFVLSGLFVVDNCEYIFKWTKHSVWKSSALSEENRPTRALLHPGTSWSERQCHTNICQYGWVVPVFSFLRKEKSLFTWLPMDFWSYQHLNEPFQSKRTLISSNGFNHHNKKKYDVIFCKLAEKDVGITNHVLIVIFDWL